MLEMSDFQIKDAAIKMKFLKVEGNEIVGLKKK